MREEKKISTSEKSFSDVMPCVDVCILSFNIYVVVAIIMVPKQMTIVLMAMPYFDLSELMNGKP